MTSPENSPLTVRAGGHNKREENEAKLDKPMTDPFDLGRDKESGGIVKCFDVTPLIINEISDPESVLFYNWQAGNTIQQCMQAFSAAITAETGWFDKARSLKKWRIIGCKDLTVGYGGYANGNGF